MHLRAHSWGPFGPVVCRNRRSRRQSGTSLIEILVVIVVFLVGILAVVQIFPGGFRLLTLTRNVSVATALGRAEVERLKSRPDQIPEQILSIRYDGSAVVEMPDRSPNDLGPMGDTVDASGILRLGTTVLGDWTLSSGPNIARRIIGEGRRVPAPVPVGTEYGGLLILNYGPASINLDSSGNPTNLIAFANDLTQSPQLPRNLTQGSAAQFGAGGSAQATSFYWSPDPIAGSEYFIDQPNTQFASVLIPTSIFDRTYRFAFSAIIFSGTTYVKRDYLDIRIDVPAISTTDRDSGKFQLIRVPLAQVLSATGALGVSESFASVEVAPTRINPAYRLIANGAAFSNDPFEYKLLEPATGVLLFSPAGYSATIERPGGIQEPLQAKVDYDVLDWRILHEDFRVYSGGNAYAQVRLALPSIKVGGQAGPDGRVMKGITLAEVSGVSAPRLFATSDYRADHLILMDTANGALIYEQDPGSDDRILVRIDKSTGLITLLDSNSGRSGVQGLELLPGTSTPTEVDLEGRGIRALYMANGEWAVQPFKAASRYSLVATRPSQAQCYVGGSGALGGAATRLYFPRADAGRKITIDTAFYRRSGDDPAAAPRELGGQDFVIRFQGTDPTGLPFIDLTDVDANAGGFALDLGYPARGVKGASMAVRVLWNPESFRLGNDSAANISAIDRWSRSYRRSTTETYLQSEDIR